MMKILLKTLTLVVALIVTASTVSAQYGQYGQLAPVESILIDKQVSKPAVKSKGGTLQYDYVDNLTPSDVRFQPGMEIMFKLRVKNTSAVTLSQVTVTDKVPWYLEPVEGPGAYDANARTISFDAGSFKPGEEKVYNLKMQWFAQDKLPADRGLMCVSNYTRAYSNNASDDDTAQACVEKQVVNVTQAPKAGPEMGIILVAGQLGMLGLGFKLRKKLGVTNGSFINNS